MRRIIPRHIHYANEIVSAGGNVPLIQVPPIDWIQMAFDTWAGLIAKCVDWTTAQINTVLGSWANMAATGALGLLDFAQNLWTGILKGANLGTFGTTTDYTLAKFADGFFTADATGRAKLADGFINELKIASDAVSSIKIKDGNVTVGKVSASFLNSVNFVLNNSFEDDIDTDGKPDGWNAGAWAGSPTWGRSAAEVKSGKYSFFLNCPAGASGFLDYIQFIPILPSTQYYYGIQAKGSVTNTPCGVAINWYQKDKTTPISSSYVGSALIGTTWDIRDGTVTSPSNAYWAQIEIFNGNQANPDTRILYIDDVVFTSLITSGIIAAGAIIADKIAAGAITANAIHADAIETDKILAGAVVSSKIALWRLTSDPTLVAGMLWWRSDLNQIRFYDGATVQYIFKFPIPFDASAILNFTWSTFIGLCTGISVIWANLATAVQTTITNAAAWIGTIIENIKTAGAVATSYLSGVISSANTALTSLADGIFTGVSGLAKFVAGFFTADATGRGKFADGIWTNVKIADLSADKISAGYLSADRIATESLVVGKLTEAARAALYPSDNLVFNGDFEDDTNADGIPDGWGNYATLSSTYSQSGKYCMKIHSDNDYRFAKQTVYIGVSEGSNYVLTFWYRSSASSAAYTVVYCYDKDKTYIDVIYPAVFNPTASFQFFAAKVPAFPSGTKFVQVSIEIAPANGTKDYYIDDLKFFRQIDVSAMLQDAIIGTAKIADLSVTTAKIADLNVTNGKINDLAAGKITTGYLDVARLEAGTIVAGKLYAGGVMADRISSNQLRTDTAIITGSLMLSDLVVTSGKLAEFLGIKSAEVPVININEYVKSCTALKGQSNICDWADISTNCIFEFNAYSYIKHELNTVTVLARVEANAYVISGTTKVRCMYTTNGTNWYQFGTEIEMGDVTTTYSLKTFSQSLLTNLNELLKVKLQGYIQVQAGADGVASLSIYGKEFCLKDRAFRSQRGDI